MKNLQTELQEHRVNVVEGTSKPVDLNQKGRQKATQFCFFCLTNRHTPSWRRKKIRNEELKKIENERTAEKRVTFTQDYKKREDQAMDQDSGITIKILITEIFRILDGIIRTVDDCLADDQINSTTETMEIDRVMENSLTRMELVEKKEFFLVHHFSQGNSLSHPQPIQPKNSSFRRSDGNQPLIPFHTNKNFRKTTIKRQRTWFASPPLMIASGNHQNFVR